MTSTPKLYLAATYADPLTLLNTAHAATGAALDALRLCPSARTWPALQITEPEQLRDRSLREHAYNLRAHKPDHETCTCEPIDLQAAATLAGEWLHLWKVTLAHAAHPDVYDTDLLRGAAQLVTDYAAFLATGNYDHLIPAQPPAIDPQNQHQLSPWFLPPRTHATPALAAAAPQ